MKNDSFRVSRIIIDLNKPPHRRVVVEGINTSTGEPESRFAGTHTSKIETIDTKTGALTGRYEVASWDTEPNRRKMHMKVVQQFEAEEAESSSAL